MNLTEKDITRFWSKVDKSGGDDACWIWTAGKTDGYGSFSIARIIFGAHRVSWAIANGEIPDGLLVCHNCPNGDNPSCVNPKHLWLGTNADNIRDRDAKGRSKNCGNRRASAPKGERNGNAKLTDAQIAEIRRLYTTGEYTHRALAKMFGVGKSGIGEILRGEIRNS